MRLRVFIATAVAALLLFSFTACGGNGDAASTTLSSEEEQARIDKLASEAEAMPEPETQPATGTTAGTAAETAGGTAAETTAEVTGTAAAEEVPQPSETSSIDKLLGDWVDVNDVDRTVLITKNGDNYQYKDNDGTYQGTVTDGILIIKISDQENDTAKVFIDAKTQNLVTDYQGDIYEFSRKVK